MAAEITLNPWYTNRPKLLDGKTMRTACISFSSVDASNGLCINDENDIINTKSQLEHCHSHESTAFGGLNEGNNW